MRSTVLRNPAFVLLIILSSLCFPGCGSSSETTETARSEPTSGREREPERDDGSEITGLMGTISQDAVRGALEPRMTQFARCFERGMAQVEFLGGDVRLSFRIDVSGQVLWVYPSSTNIGDLTTESCILDVARSTHFPRPRGGEAEFSWGFGMDPPDDVRPPLSWGGESLGDVLERSGREVRSRCGRGPFRITAYVAPGGQVLAAGGSSSDAESLAALSCVVDAVRTWAMPDPGSYAAKVTFDL